MFAKIYVAFLASLAIINNIPRLLGPGFQMVVIFHTHLNIAENFFFIFHQFISETSSYLAPNDAVLFSQ
jgi:hypothetical protein